jgi:uncharacterized protein
MGVFVGRGYELEQLALLKRKASSSMVAVTGRRRIGKSRLIEEFAKRSKGYRYVAFSGIAPDQGVSAHEQRADFARQMQRQLGIPPVVHDDWGDLFAHVGRAVGRGKWIVLLDEISWMASGDRTFLPKLKNAWDLSFSKNAKLVLVVCSSISSWLENNILSSTGFVGRISLNIRLEELPVSDCLDFPGMRQGTASFYDQFKMLSVTGGVPKYLEELVASQSAEENIRRLCFESSGLLFREFRQIFSDLFETRNALYERIVTTLADRRMDLTELCKAIGLKKSGAVGGYVDDLRLAGFVEKDYAWDLNNGLEGRRFTYRVKDNYVRFYLKHIAPHRNAISKNRFRRKKLSALAGWDAVMGLQFENLVLQNREFIWQQCGVSASEIVNEGPFFQTATKRRRGCQIDYLIQTKHGPLYLCEIKFLRKKVGADVLADLQHKGQRLAKPRHASMLPVLIHVNGVTEAVAESDYLARIIDLSDITLN